MDNQTELHLKFQILLRLADQYEQEGSDDQKLIDLIEKFQKAQQDIIKEKIFSPNEEFEEIQTENLRFLFLPFYVGLALTQIQFIDLRQKNLVSADYYIQEFLKLLDHYQLLNPQQKKLWKQFRDSKKFEFQREDKILNFKETKQLTLQIQNLMKIDDAKQARDLVLAQIQVKVYQSFDLLAQNQQEMEILKFRDQLSKDKNVKDQYQQELQKPIPKMTVWNIPKPQDKPSIFSPQQGCKHCTEAELKQELIAKVWQPTNQPTMTLDEFADMEIDNMKKQEAMQKKAMEEQKKIDEEKDDDKDFWSDQQTLKDRHWDDWKDANEKGAGNKMR
ncbi:hypothetical protein pb186bvf_014374 [Paramecium bursaria]